MSGHMIRFAALLIILLPVVSMVFSKPVKSSLLESNSNDDLQLDFNKLSYNPDKQNVLMEMEWDSVFYMDESYHSSVTDIIFLGTLDDMPSNAWDVSEDNDGSVMVWTVMNEQGCCDLFVAGEGGVWANPDSTWLF